MLNEYELPVTVECPQCGQHARLFNRHVGDQEYPVARCQQCGTHNQGTYVPDQRFGGKYERIVVASFNTGKTGETRNEPGGTRGEGTT